MTVSASVRRLLRLTRSLKASGGNMETVVWIHWNI